MASLLDSNILIYAGQPGNEFLDEWLEAPGTTPDTATALLRLFSFRFSFLFESYFLMPKV